MQRVGRFVAVIAAGVVATQAACKATTGRPAFVPFPEAEHVELGFNLAGDAETVFMVTDTVVARLRADSIPVRRVKRIDGFLETEWFDAKTLKPTSRRPLGQDVVKVRGFVDPTKPGFSRVEVETVYIPRADPSLPDRELEAPVPTAHPVNRRIGSLLKSLAKQYGIPEDSTKTADDEAPGGDRANARPGRPGRAVTDSVKADTTRAAAGKRPPRPVPPPPPPPSPPAAPARVHQAALPLP